MTEVRRYRAHKMGFGTGELAFASDAYEHKEGDESSHRILARWLERRSASRILDLGCSDGSFAQRLRDQGHHVTGVDLAAHDGVEDRVDEFVHGRPGRTGCRPSSTGPYDVVLAADVLEHLRTPDVAAREICTVCWHRAPRCIVSVPNFGHWYPRLRVALGRFDYDRRGILDTGHVRFFTRRSIERLVARQRLLDRAPRGHGPAARGHGAGRRGPGADLERRVRRLVSRLDRVAVEVRPQLFGYQFLYELRPRR